MKYFLLICVCMLCSSFASAQPGTVTMTPHVDLHLKQQLIEVPEKYKGKVSENLKVYLPDGFKAKVFYIGSLSKPRFFAWSPDSVLHVANQSSGVIIALPDNNHDGVADTAIVVASGFDIPHDLKFYRGSMYVAEQGRIIKCTDTNGDGQYSESEKQVFIDGIPTGGNHVTRTIVFDSLAHTMYLSIGSSCNVCRQNNRAHIEVYNDDGTGKRIFASGTRNAVGMTLHPRTGKLWANNNGSDSQGDDIPPEWIDIVRDGGYYGWPFVYGDQVYFNLGNGAPADYRALAPVTAADSALVRTMVQPAALIQAHSAPMAIEFSNSSFPPPFSNGAFTALRGSWNRSIPTGFKVVYLGFEPGNDSVASFVADFLTGFLTDSIGTTRDYARPVGLETDSRGNLYVSSDEDTHFILTISSPASTDVPEYGTQSKDLEVWQNYPNPTSSSTTFRFSIAQSGHVRFRVLDLFGREIATVINAIVPAGEHSLTFDASDLADGLYFYQVQSGNTTITKRMTVAR